MAKFTPAQQVAINTRNKTLLLSAAAGSGKTTTLTERIIRSITEEGADISKMLIVTFTRASASDLKTKITAAINKALASDPTNTHLSSQLIKLVSAKISTIDAFYLSSVKQNFASLGLSSSFRIADETETVLLAKDTARSVVGYFFDNDAEFPILCECFENIKDTDDDTIGQLLIDLYERKLRTIPEGVEYIRMCAEEMQNGADGDFFESRYGKIVKKHVLSAFRAYYNEYERLLDKVMPLDEKLYRGYSTSFADDRAFCLKVVNALEGKTGDGTYACVCDVLNSYSFAAIGKYSGENAELKEYCQSFRKDFKSTVEKLKKEYFCYSPKDFERYFSETARLLSVLYRVLAEFERRYLEEKNKRNILELADVKRYAYRLFVTDDKKPTEYAKTVAEQFSDIYIDEYQDVDPVQDLIFSCISTPTNRFMVGDIKQSIYRFRDAKPQLFADYRAKFPAHGTPEAQTSDCETIFMSDNFRCTQKIIDFTNLVCGDIFRACGDSIGYTSEDDLVYPEVKKDDPDGPDISVALFGKTQKTMPELDIYGDPVLPPDEAEAQYVAGTIYKLLTEGKRVNGEPFKPSDIAVIYKAHSASFAITEALSKYGIQTTNADQSQYFQNPDVVMTLCILNAVDNPQRDVHLAGAMRSPIFGFTVEDLMLINTRGDKSFSLYDKVCELAEEDTTLGKKCRDFKDVLEEWRCISLSMPIDKFLRRIFASDKFVASGLVSERNDLGEGGNLQTLYEYARTFEAGSFKGLYNFIEFINTLIENGKTLKVKNDDASDRCVRLTTIHSSKGLEFPVCFVIGCSSDFACLKSPPNYSFEYGVGMAMSLPDRTGFARYSSPLKKVIDLYSKTKGIEEEMRVLYVALTRAKEQLFVSGYCSRSLLGTALADARYNAQFKCDYNIFCASSFMDWILPVFYGVTKPAYAHFNSYSTDNTPRFSLFSSTKPKQDDKEYNKELYERLIESFSFEYPYSSLGRLPAKLSVSRLSPDVLDDNDKAVNLFEEKSMPPIPSFFLESEKRATAAQKGTATHHFLQFCDFSFAKENGIDKTVDMLIAKGFIPSSYADILYRDELCKLMDCGFVDRILSANKVIREQRFNILLPSEFFTRDDALKEKIRSESIAVQGVIDLILIDGDGNIELYDYKTDRLTRDELNDTGLATLKMNELHGLQLSYYAEAVKRLFGKAPSRVAVYSTHSARLYDIEPRGLSIPADSL